MVSRKASLDGSSVRHYFECSWFQFTAGPNFVPCANWVRDRGFEYQFWTDLTNPLALNFDATLAVRFCVLIIQLYPGHNIWPGPPDC